MPHVEGVNAVKGQIYGNGSTEGNHLATICQPNIGKRWRHMFMAEDLATSYDQLEWQVVQLMSLNYNRGWYKIFN